MLQARCGSEGGRTAIKAVVPLLLQDEALALRYHWLDLVFSQAPGAMAIVAGRELRMAFVNDAYTRHVGGREVVGLTVEEAFPEFKEQGFVDLLQQVFATGEPYSATEVPVEYKSPTGDVDLRYVNFSHVPIRGEDGNVVAIFHELIDVTDLKRARAEVHKLHLELVHMSRLSAMGTMASTLAHELNQPLTAALNFIQGSRRILDSAPPDALLAIENAGNAVQRAADIIAGLRKMLSKKEPVRAPVAVLELVETASLLGMEGRQATVDLRVEVPEDLYVLADKLQLEQVLINLIRNAAEAMEQSECRTLSIGASAESGQATISVRDRGPGLSPEARSRLFEATFSTKPDGMGLGLSICRTIMEMNKGRIWAEDNPDGGMIFWLSVPASDAPAAHTDTMG